MTKGLDSKIWVWKYKKEQKSREKKDGKRYYLIGRKYRTKEWNILSSGKSSRKLAKEEGRYWKKNHQVKTISVPSTWHHPSYYIDFNTGKSIPKNQLGKRRLDIFRK